MRALFAFWLMTLLAAPVALADGPAGTPDEPAAARSPPTRRAPLAE